MQSHPSSVSSHTTKRLSCTGTLRIQKPLASRFLMRRERRYDFISSDCGAELLFAVDTLGLSLGKTSLRAADPFAARIRKSRNAPGTERPYSRQTGSTKPSAAALLSTLAFAAASFHEQSSNSRSVPILWATWRPIGLDLAIVPTPLEKRVWDGLYPARSGQPIANII